MLFGSVAVPDSDIGLKCLDFLPAMTFPHADGKPMSIGAGALDSGEGLKTYDAYRWVMRQSDRWYASKGRGSGQIDVPVRLKLLAWETPSDRRDETAKQVVREGRVRFVEINGPHYKSLIFSRLRLEPTNVMDEPGRMYFPAWEPIDPRSENSPDRHGLDGYLRQLTSEHLVAVKVKSGVNAGRTVNQWQKRPGRDDNHHLDTCVGTLALADALNVDLITAERFAAARAKLVNGQMVKLPNGQMKTGEAAPARGARPGVRTSNWVTGRA